MGNRNKVPRMLMSNRAKALALQLLAILCWSISPIITRFVKESFTVHFQNLIRNLASVVFLWPAVCFIVGKGLKDTFRRLPPLLPKIGLIVLFTYLFQVGFTVSLYLIYPGIMTLIYQSNVVFSVLLASSSSRTRGRPCDPRSFGPVWCSRWRG